MSDSISEFTFPTRILFGDGALGLVPRETSRLGLRRPLIVSDPGLEAAGLKAQLADLLPDAVWHLEVHGNPEESDVTSGLDTFHASGCDGIIGFGGGSPIDVAKAVRLLVTHVGRLSDYDVTLGGLSRITADLPPMIAIPTTAGTGSEVGRATLIQIPGTGRKAAIISPHLLPTLSICDPELTYGLSPQLTAGTGMDAFTHGIESYLSTTFHPICDGIALEGLTYVRRGLETCVQEAGNQRARRNSLMGSLLCGISMHKGLGVVHSLSHALGGEGRAHHGTLNAILLPHALRFNCESASERIVTLAGAMGLGRGQDSARHLIALTQLVLARLPLPNRLGEIDGLSRERIPEYGRLAMLDHCHRTNPRPCTIEDMIDLLQVAW